MMFKNALGTPIFSNFFLRAKREWVPHPKLLVILLENIFRIWTWNKGSLPSHETFSAYFSQPQSTWF